MKLLLAIVAGGWASALLAAAIIAAYNSAAASGLAGNLVSQDAVLWIVGIAGAAGALVGLVVVADADSRSRGRALPPGDFELPPKP